MMIPQVSAPQDHSRQDRGPSRDSRFLTHGGKIFHTYSTYARGSDPTIGAYALLDLTALGRHEDWEEPKGRAAKPHPADPTFTS
jgi:predicted dithiol-disulfide oxidoreductase (DUF899 family)